MSKFLRHITFNLSYLFHPRWDTGIPAPELVRVVAERPAGRAIDIGCGTGTNVSYLAQHGWQVTGIDYAPLAIQKATARLGKITASLLVADVSKLADLALSGPFDLALDMGCFHSLTHADRQAYVRGLERWLAPHGLYMVYAFQPVTPGAGPGLTREEMLACFETSFRLSNYEQGQGRPSAWYYFERK